LFPLCFTRIHLEPPPPSLLAAARLHVEPPPPRPRARPAPPVRACAARATALRRRLRSPPPPLAFLPSAARTSLHRQSTAVLHVLSSPRSSAAFASPRRSHIHSTFHPVLARCSTFCLSRCFRAAFVFRTPPVAMGREKRKGKEV